MTTLIQMFCHDAIDSTEILIGVVKEKMAVRTEFLDN